VAIHTRQKSWSRNPESNNMETLISGSRKQE
jgi:hypothetical protein